MDEFDASSVSKAPYRVVSTELPVECEQESNLSCNAVQEDEPSNKRPLEDGENFESLKAPKLSDSIEGQEMLLEAMQVSYTGQTDEQDAQDQDDGMEVLSDADSNEVHYQNQLEVQPNSCPPVNQEDQETVEIEQPKPDNRQVAPLPDLPGAQDGNPSRQLQVATRPGAFIGSLGREVTLSCLSLCARSDYGSLLLLNKDFHSLIRSGEVYKVRRKIGKVEHWVYFSYSLLEWEAYDPMSGRWMHLPRMNTGQCFMFSDKESMSVGTELLVFGREIESHATYKYSILTNTWTRGMKMLTGRSLFASASLGTIGIVAGGCDQRGCLLTSAELYSSETGIWVPLPSMKTARKMCSGAFVDGKFYVIGGIDQDGEPISSAEIYDLETQTWQEIPGMYPDVLRGVSTPAATAPPLVAVVSNEMYLAHHAENMIRKYVEETNKWVVVGFMPKRSDSTNGWGLAFRGCGDQIICIGGQRHMIGGTIELKSWFPKYRIIPVWELLASKPAPNFVYNCTVMGC